MAETATQSGFTQGDAYRVYDRVRGPFTGDWSFEGCPWFIDDAGRWCRERDGRRMVVYGGEGGEAPCVDLQTKEGDDWRTSSRHCVPKGSV